MHKTNKILFVAPVLGDTKDTKRIELLIKAGFDVKVAAFNRHSFVSRMPKCKTIIIGDIVDGNYIYRLFVMLLSIFKLRRHIKEADLVYTIGVDLAMFSYLSSIGLKRSLILDVADIREIQVSKSFSGALVRAIDKFMISKIDLLVVTSKGFVDYYYYKILNKKINNYILIENKVDYKINIVQVNEEKSKKIRIGYFGVLRDNWTIKLFVNILEKYPDRYEVVLAGINLIKDFDLIKLSDNYRGFTFLGEYKSPDDLIDIYSSIDIMAVFYPDYNSSDSWFNAKRICRSNRFYESCYFKKPIIAFSFTNDGTAVSELDIGLTIETYNISEATSKIVEKVTFENIECWVNVLNVLPNTIYVFVDEVKTLRARIELILKKE